VRENKSDNNSRQQRSRGGKLEETEERQDARAAGEEKAGVARAAWRRPAASRRGEPGWAGALMGEGSGGGSREAPGGLCNALCATHLPYGLSKPIRLMK